jgi:hypothetical protein
MIAKQMVVAPVLGGSFSSVDDLCEDHGGFNGLTDEELDKWDVIAATYDQQQYEGSAWVLLYRDGKLYEVSSSHCSCNGLDWHDPSETSLAAMKMRECGNYSTGGFADSEWEKVLEAASKAIERVI